MDTEDLQDLQTKAISEELIAEFLNNLNHNKCNNEDVLYILRNPTAQRYFKYNTNQFCAVFSKVVDSAENEVFLIALLKNEFSLYKNIVESNTFYVNFFETLLPVLIKTCVRFQDKPEVFHEISKLIQKSILGKTSKVFASYLDDESKNANPDAQQYAFCKAFFKFLQNLYNSENDENSFGYKLLFHSFCQSAVNDFPAIYKMFATIVDILGFEVKDNLNINIKIKLTKTNHELNKSLRILNILFKVLTSLKVETECELNKISFTDFVKNLLKSVISLSRAPNSNTYNILSNVIEINPLVVEPISNEIISYVMLADNKQIQNEYETCLIQILEVYSKLHRMQNFISKLIPTLKSNLEKRQVNETIYKFKTITSEENSHGKVEYQVETMFPKRVLAYLTSCITNLASWQVMNLFKTLLFHLGKAVEELPECTDATPKFIYLEVLSTLMSCFMCSVRIAENTVLTSSIQKFVAGLEDLRNILGKFGENLVQREHNHILMRAFLNICFNWGEIYMTLAYYSINEEVQIRKTLDNDFTLSNLTYLHSYLSKKEWYLISERITNFGETPCKIIMNKLVIQKLRAQLIFEDDIPAEMTLGVDKHFCSTFEKHPELITDKFVVNNLIDKFPPASIIAFCEIIVNCQLADSSKPQLFDSQLIVNGVLTVLCSKISKLFKQKRKHDDDSVTKPLCTRLFACLPPEGFLDDHHDEILQRIVEILTLNKDTDRVLDLKMHENKILEYLEILRQIPIIFCREFVQKVFIVVMFALHRDICSSNSEKSLKTLCENLIISVIQYTKFDLMDMFQSDFLIKIATESFDKFEEFNTCLINNIFRSDESITNFQPAVSLVKENMKNEKYLKSGIIILNQIGKVKKTKATALSKQTCLQYKSEICTKLLKILSKRKPEHHLIHPYALLLKSFLVKDENDSLSKLRACLPDYVEFSLANVTENSLRGILLLYTTILHKKSSLAEINSDFSIRVWNSLQQITISNEIIDEFAHLVVLIASSIPNEQFSSIFGDLLQATTRAMDQTEKNELSKHLKTWKSILTTNFNAVKVKIIHEQLELLLQKLILMMQCIKYREDLFEEIIQFEVSIIQTNHLPLTSAIIDQFLLSVTILMMTKNENFNHVYNSSMGLMENLLKHRNPLIMDRLPPYLQQYRLLLRELCFKSNSNLKMSQCEILEVDYCAHELEKLTKSLVASPKDMSRISLYLIADILGQFETVTLCPSVKIHLNNCVYSLMSLCDQHAVQYLMRVPSNASTEMFKIMYENYKKYYRFTGKV